ncbi:aldehyde ferredoxin oxidoreductase family protein [Wolinella succinogenes]|uniref:ALDEHYDE OXIDOREDUCTASE n=1 Tax=Wolinella succinogenes (strain ATCC 29543 / DSM 1740 / CCUG 13145 / JCM 31913 / LMG 7466 / NCTC 11488 / FDC 602W) TaxID=273121 RepID=Q7MA94_WOLSU|nr:aldehyde ferredoxin oxidoreductase C-terminal domain-containing protein [Wolinella succinogenes]NLU33666.1 aldehyde ferredoxin oxidoreductase [Wolinella succinogenes]CAE09541.1 ALDEHYDE OXIDOREDUCTASE [Wolinella succinogenes]VEG81754.1 putative oxidoreductase [Wolinella succinogenes]HCZ18341.1 aldehyde ferredoxin oxidoreductase [Helicobacter sp.]
MAEMIYRVNMSEKSFSISECPKEWQEFGGRGLTSAIVAAEVDPLCHPLGANNKLVFAPGSLSGTTAANSGRTSVGAKSPLTNGIKESNVGGTSAQAFAKLGIKALIIEGAAPEGQFYRLHITKDNVEFIDAKEILGKNNRYVTEKMLELYGRKVSVLTIGRAGENRMLVSNISVKDPDGKLRSMGRGAMGAVMGSKGLKCVTVDQGSTNEVNYVDEARFREAAKVFATSLKEDDVSGKGLPAFGTNVLVNIINEAGALPTRNFRSGRFEFAENISGETMAENIKARGGKTTHGCHAGCIIQCSQVYNTPEGEYQTSGFEYEMIWAYGAHTGINDLDVIAQIDSILDDYGLDAIETGVTFGVAVDAGILEYGDGKRVVELLEEINNATPLGRILGSGAANLGRCYGLSRVPVVKGQSIPAYDPRAIKGQGITYATTTMGADHTAGYAVAVNILGSGGTLDPLKKEGQIELSRNLQIATAAVDSTGMCIFTAFPMLSDPKAMPALVQMIEAKTGATLGMDGLVEYGKKVLKLERNFNERAGLNRAHDRLPEFFKEPLPPHNVVWDFTDEELDSLWNF